MDGLLVVRDPGVVRTTKILPNSNEADFIHRRSSVGKSAKLELSYREEKWFSEEEGTSELLYPIRAKSLSG